MTNAYKATNPIQREITIDASTTNRRNRMRWWIDFAMAWLFVSLMARSFMGNVAHELMGVALFLFFCVHVALNRKWYMTLLQGTYRPARIYRIVMNIPLTVAIVGAAASGIPISQDVFSFAGIKGGPMIERLHLFFSFWCLIIAAVHLGAHRKMIASALKRWTNIHVSSPARQLLCGLTTLYSLYGIYVIYKRHTLEYLLLESGYTFLPDNDTALLMLADFCAMACLFACSPYIASRIFEAGQNLCKAFRSGRFLSS